MYICIPKKVGLPKGWEISQRMQDLTSDTLLLGPCGASKSRWHGISSINTSAHVWPQNLLSLLLGKNWVFTSWLLQKTIFTRSLLFFHGFSPCTSCNNYLANVIRKITVSK